MVARALLLNAGAFLIVVGVGEAGVRTLSASPGLPSNVSYVPGRTFRYTSPRRGDTGAIEFDVDITLNRYGFHGPDHPPRRKEGYRRVALIGDSMVEAFQVRREEGLAARLEAELSMTEVLGFGKGGHSTMRQDRILREVQGLLAAEGGAAMPDAAVYVVHGPYAVRQALVDFVRAPAYWRRGLAWLLREYDGPSVFLLRARDSVLRGLIAPPDDMLREAGKVFWPGYRSDTLDLAWSMLEGKVAGLVRDSKALGIRPIFVYIPDASEMAEPGDRYDPLACPARFREFAVKAGADWIDLSPEFRTEGKGATGGLFFEHDQHPSPRGHALAARLLAKRLKPLLDAVPDVK